MYIVPLVMQGLPALLLFFSQLACNESPRWLARKDRWEEARNILSLVRNLPQDHPYVAGEIQEIWDQLEHERTLIGGAKYKDLMREMWTIPGNRNRALLTIGLMICQQMTGTNAINYYAPQIFENLGLNGTESGLFATGVYGIVKMVMCFCFLVFAADSLGRRRSLLWTSVAMAASMMYVGLYVRIDPPQEDDVGVPPAGYVALVCIYLFASFFQWGWGPVCWIYVSEIPTARLRGLNVSLGAATQWLFNLVIARAVPNMLVTMGEGGYGAFILFASFCAAMFVFVWFLVPETKVCPPGCPDLNNNILTSSLRACLWREWTTSSVLLSSPRRSRTRKQRTTWTRTPLSRSRRRSNAYDEMFVDGHLSEMNDTPIVLNLSALTIPYCWLKEAFSTISIRYVPCASEHGLDRS